MELVADRQVRAGAILQPPGDEVFGQKVRRMGMYVPFHLRLTGLIILHSLMRPNS